LATNVEIKARVQDLAGLHERAEQLSDTPVELLLQEDTFFVVPKGRLKLRVLAPDRGQLVYYEREDRAGPKSSYYLVAPTPDPASLHAALAAALGVRGVVRKRRWLFLVGQTRVHLDDVEELGAFMELEVVLQPGQSSEEGQAIAEDLMERLGIAREDLIEGAYMDLLEARASAGPA
jgi:predicted adenylyl cyclase CyaB